MTTALTEIIEPAVAALGFEFIGCEKNSHGHGGLLRVYIDSPHGITVEDCEKVSRQVSAVLDVEDPIRGRYTLEVSSPGLERPLFTLEQYRRFIGNKIHIRLRVPHGTRRNYMGILRQVMDETIVIAMPEEVVELSFEEIQKAHLVYEFGIAKN